MSQPRRFLNSNFGRSREAGTVDISGIAQGVNARDLIAICSENMKVVIGEDPLQALVRFHDAKLVDDRSLLISRGPDQNPVGNFPVFSSLNVVFCHVGDMGADFNLDFVLLQLILGIFGQLFVKGGEDVLRHIMDTRRRFPP